MYLYVYNVALYKIILGFEIVLGTVAHGYFTNRPRYTN